MSGGLIVENGIYRCPECHSKKITEVSQNVLIKMINLNTGKLINPETGKCFVSNKYKAFVYDSASSDGVGCWYYECRNCGWKSELLVE